NVSKEDQKFVSNTIHKIVTLQATEKEKMLLEELVGKLKNQGAEAIVLGCTDLEILIKGDHEIEIIDSMHTLAVAAFNKLLLNEKQVIL
ncbi:MAG: aspartate/glutamate racemase family protein, partial [Candidatus Aenigmarchaeota archaeon]|nr:aspartate/glutamate racemase family protein [Candidatus Aenigmarchaeota archaeon]